MTDDARPNRYVLTILEIGDKLWEDLSEPERRVPPSNDGSLRIRLEPVGETTSGTVNGEFEITGSVYKELGPDSRGDALRRYSNLYGAGALGGCVGEVTIAPAVLEKVRRGIAND